MVTRETIERYFRRTCTPQEAEDVRAYFDENPGSFDFLEKEWNEFEAPDSLSRDVSNKIWHGILTDTKRAAVVPLYVKRLAIAASIVIILSAGWILLRNGSKPSDAPVTLVENHLREISNTTNASLTIRLSDSSIIELMPNSSVSFLENFDSLKRLVRLSGEADFAVSKDPARPFSVISDSITTTALGTKFTVQAYRDAKQIKVALHEGKVKLTSDLSAFKADAGIYYLYPGDVFVYNKITHKATLQTHNAKNAAVKTGVPSKGNPVIESDNWYMFNNQPLADVIDQLQVLYDARIDYKKADLRGMSFIGKLDKTDSLATILNSIALLNDLQVSKQGNTYVLAKKK